MVLKEELGICDNILIKRDNTWLFMHILYYIIELVSGEAYFPS